MFPYLLLLFTVVPALELALLIKVGSFIGALNTILVIILTGALGAAIARWQGFTVLRNIQDRLQEGVMPTDDLIDGVMILAGGILLLTPGFLTDGLGFILLVPWSRSVIKWLIKERLQNTLDQRVIDAEFRVDRGPQGSDDTDFS